MKWIVLFIFASAITFASCKTCRHKTVPDVNNMTTVTGATTGTVSHQFRADGCSTVIIVAGEEDLILIPVKGLPAELDVDGKVLLFDYVMLRMPQPEGCMKGLPAELTNLSEKK